MSSTGRGVVALACAAFPAAAQESRAVFDAPLVVLPGDNRIEHLVDADGDGRMDLVSWWYVSSSKSQARLRLWRNMPDGSFVEQWAVLVPGLGSSLGAHVAIGDANADGTDDFAVEYARTITILRGNGLAAPTQLQSITADVDQLDVALADMDGDGDGDLVYHEIDGQVNLQRNLGAPGFQQQPSGVLNVGPVLSAMRVGELTGDGIRDLLFVHDHSFRIVPLTPSLNAAAPIVVPTASWWIAPRPAIGDLDGDGDDDLVIWDGQGSGGFYEVYRRTGPSSWTLEAPRDGGPATELADIDGDGDLDGICCGGGGGYVNWLNSIQSTFNICRNDGTGLFTHSFQMRGAGSTHIAGATDIDLDGDTDLVAGRAIYYARGPITGSPNFELPGPPAAAHDIDDFDDDGDFDVGLALATAQRSFGQTSFAPFAVALPPAPAGSAFMGQGYRGDFDGDGDQDRVVSRFDGGQFAAMQLLANLGNGEFVDAGPAGAPGVSFNFGTNQNVPSREGLAADLDGDGDQDLLTRPRSIATLYGSQIFLNDGTGFFTFASGIASTTMAIGDLDGDSLPDLVTGAMPSAGPHRIEWYRNAGGGSFVLGTWLSGSATIQAHRDDVALLDLGDDGDLDIVSASRGGSPAYLVRFRNDGGGAFHQSFLPYYLDETFDGGLHVLATDVDADGLDDVVAWPAFEAGHSSAILLGDATALGLEAPYYQAMRPAAFVDLDSDGDQDVIGLAWDDTKSAVTVARRIDGPQSGARRQYGEGSPGGGGCVPILGAVGPFRAGELMQLRIRGGRGAANGYLAVGVAEGSAANTPFQGMTLYVGTPHRKLGIKLDGPLGVPCAGEKTRQFVVPGAYAGHTWFHQAFVYDPAAPNGLSASNGLEIQYD